MIEYIQCCLLFVSFCFRFTSTNLHDDTWQHVCLTRENTQGLTKLYKDGRITEQVTNDATKNYVLKAGGALELGQDLLAEALIVCKLFMADWQVSTCKIKFESNIASQYTNCSVPHGSVLNWSIYKNLAHGNHN